MLAATICLVSVLVVLAVSEYFWRSKILKGEWLRKFVHMTVASFVAFWPWLMSWGWIRLIGVAFVAGVAINRRFKIFHMLAGLRKKSLGDIDFALAVTLCSFLTDIKIFFCLAILHLALADGAAALIGKKWGGHWRYLVFGQAKTVVGSLAFWVTSILILGTGGLLAHNYLTFNAYLLILFALPPVLMALENLSYLGADNLTVPAAVIIALRLVS